MSDEKRNAIAERLDRAANILAKWRVLFTGWQLGTRPKGDPEGDAVRDHREVTILLRAEVNAIAKVLLDKGIMTEEYWSEVLAGECELLSKDYEKKFPGVKADLLGLTFTAEARETMRGWKP